MNERSCQSYDSPPVIYRQRRLTTWRKEKKNPIACFLWYLIAPFICEFKKKSADIPRPCCAPFCPKFITEPVPKRGWVGNQWNWFGFYASAPHSVVGGIFFLFLSCPCVRPSVRPCDWNVVNTVNGKVLDGFSPNLQHWCILGRKLTRQI